MPYTNATSGRDKNGRKTVTYRDANGNIEVRVGGTPAWRNNNPGNLESGMGAIGNDGRFAIFSDETAGRDAQRTLIQTKYINYNSIREMLRGKFNDDGTFIDGTAWAPKKDGNNPDLYADTIRKWTGLDVDNKKINDLTNDEMQELLYAMKRYEGWGDGERFWIGPDGKPINYSPYELIMGSGGGGGGIDQTRQSFTTATTAVVGCGDPLVLDLDGDGIETTLVADGAYFDHDGNGFAEQTGWAGSDDGLLAWDRNGDGIINGGRELFNDPIGFPGMTNGFQVLAALDGNQDGKIDTNDAIWNQLKIWQDYDGDGYSNADELRTLSELGIVSINTGYNNSSYVDPNGNEHRQVGSFTWADGTSGNATDVWFETDKMYTIANEWLDVPTEITVLPDLQAYGNVYDLHQAMVRDGSGQLSMLVQNFMASLDPTVRNSIMEQILFKWTGSDGINPTSRGPNIDARKLAVLEKFFGQAFVGVGGSDPNVNAAALLNQSYRGMFEMFYAGLMVQTHLKDLYEKITYSWDEATQSLRGNLSPVIIELQNRIAVDPIAGKNTLSEFARTLRGFQAEAMVDYWGFRNTFATQSEELVWVIDSAGKNIINGTTGNDILSGTDSDDAIRGDSGNDSLYGNGGNDALYGQSGTNYLFGNDGDDLISGGTVNDYLYGGIGSDALEGGSGNDYLQGDAGNDTYLFSRGSGQDTIYDYDTTLGNLDTLRFSPDVARSDVEMIRSGDDMIFKIKGTSDQILVKKWLVGEPYQVEKIIFGDGTMLGAQDVIESTAEIRGTIGDDTISGTRGLDRIYGEGGNDTLNGMGGNDSIYGGDGNDTLYGGEIFSPNTHYGESYHDYLRDRDGNNSLYGNAGDDIIYAGGGDDVIDGGPGNDTLDGWEGNDVYLFGRGSGQDTIADDDGTDGGLDTLRFASDVFRQDVEMSRSGEDIIFKIKGTSDQVLMKEGVSSGALEKVELGDGTVLTPQEVNDLTVEIRGTSDNDTIYGSSITDWLYGEGGSDRLWAYGGNDLIYGGDDNDYLYGGNDNDTLYGGAGNDYLYGDWDGYQKWYGGTDVLDGGPGNDYLAGEKGGDIYLFGRGSGQDTIYDEDINPYNDILRFASDVARSDVEIMRNGSDVIFQIKGTSDVVVIEDMLAGTAYQVERIEFGDGIVLTPQDLTNLPVGILGTTSNDSLRGCKIIT